MIVVLSQIHLCVEHSQRRARQNRRGNKSENYDWKFGKHRKSNIKYESIFRHSRPANYHHPHKKPGPEGNQRGEERHKIALISVKVL